MAQPASDGGVAASRTPDATTRLIPTSSLRRFLIRPEMGAVAGAAAVLIFFGFAGAGSGMWDARGVTSLLEISAQLGILAAPMALLIIAGEFDLSIGSMIGAAGIVFALGTVVLHVPAWAMILATIAFSLAIGWVNGVIVVKLRVSSFVVTLASLFALRGVSVGVTRLMTGRTQVPGIEPLVAHDWLATILRGNAFGGFYQWMASVGWIKTFSSGAPEVVGLPIVVLWWIGATALASWVLRRTRFGNWIYATGGAPDAARNVGVPTDRVKIILFMATSCSAALLALIQVMEIGSADTLRGLQKEFEAIIAVVVGGTLLGGGYGSAIGASFGALIFGTVQIGLFYTGVDTDWFNAFVGGILLLAVVFNNFVRAQLTRVRD
jgi:simple sugar transport system permease protein